NFALPRGFSVFAAAPTNLPMKYQDVLPGAHPKPGAVEFGVGKGPFQFGAGSGKEGVYGLLRVSLKPLQIGNRELHPQADGHIMLSPDAEASHQGHGPNPMELHTAVTVSQDVKVPPAALLDLIKDPFFKDKDARLQFNERNSAWLVGFRDTRRMAMGGQMMKMTTTTNIEIPDLLKHLKDPNDANEGNSPEALERIEGFYEARVREIIGEMMEIEDENIPLDQIKKRISPLYMEGQRYGVLFQELESEYRKAISD